MNSPLSGSAAAGWRQATSRYPISPSRPCCRCRRRTQSVSVLVPVSDGHAKRKSANPLLVIHWPEVGVTHGASLMEVAEWNGTPVVPLPLDLLRVVVSQTLHSSGKSRRLERILRNVV